MSKPGVLVRIWQLIRNNKKYWLLPIIVAAAVAGFVSVQIFETVTPAGPPVYDSFLDDANCRRILGWAWDSNRPYDPVEVEIFDGDTPIGVVAADQFRQNLLDERRGNGKHGFSFDVPPALRDGKLHWIRVTVAGTQIELSNSPKKIFCNP